MLVVAALGGNALQRRGQPLEAEFAETNAKAAAIAAGRGRARAPARRDARQRSPDRAARTPGRGVPRRAQLPARPPRRGERGHDRLPPRARAGERAARPSCRVAAHADRGRRARPRVPQADEADRTACTTRTTPSVSPASGAGPSRPTTTAGGVWSRRPFRDRSSRPRPSSCCSTTTCSSCARVAAACPSSIDNEGARHGVEAVVDKDAATALLARNLDADVLLLLTDVAAVERRVGNAQGAAGSATITRPRAAARWSSRPGSMAPKAAAAASFVPRHRRPRRDRRARRRGRPWWPGTVRAPKSLR